MKTLQSLCKAFTKLDFCEQYYKLSLNKQLNNCFEILPLKLESSCTPLKINAIAPRDIFLKEEKSREGGDRTQFCKDLVKLLVIV